jgi:integrase
MDLTYVSLNGIIPTNKEVQNVAKTYKKMASDRGKTGSARQLWQQAQKYMRNANTRSFRTRETHLDKLSSFVDHVGDKFHLQKIEKMTDKHVLSYVEDAYTRGLSSSTIWNTVSAVQYLSNQFAQGVSHISDTSRLKEKYVERQIEKNEDFSKKEIQRHYVDIGKNPAWTQTEIDKATDLALKMGRFDVAISIQFGVELGTRIHETFRQDRTALRKAIKSGKLTTKGKKGYIRNIKAQQESQREILQIAKNLTSVDHQKAFIQDEKNFQQSMKSVQNWLYNHRKKFADAEDRELTYHGLRYTFAQREFERIEKDTGSTHEALRQVSKQLGHHRIWMTQVYLNR